jgi:hypothetical protein
MHITAATHVHSPWLEELIFTRPLFNNKIYHAPNFSPVRLAIARGCKLCEDAIPSSV